ncbi:MAG: hypothetical protein WC661_02100 [Opitutaceae bacterium]|jgi:hypothetical protein
MSHPGITLDQECFLEHLASPAFQQGLDRGWWGIVQNDAVAWPEAILWVSAPPRPNSPDRFHLRFKLGNYPEKAPTAMVWDLEHNQRLDLAKWPKGKADVAMAFRTNWNNAVALYVPWDRVALESHHDWVAKHPGVAWKRTHTIVHYLRMTYELLWSDEYTGV